MNTTAAVANVTTPVVRPGMTSGAAGPLGTEFFQTAYVTNDLDRAIAEMREHNNIPEFFVMDTPLPDGSGSIAIALAWTGGVQIEIIEPRAPNTVYENVFSALKEEGFGIRHHHFGYFVNSDEEWDALEAYWRDNGIEIAFGDTTDGFLRFAYIWNPTLNHYLEYVQPFAGLKEVFENVPSS